MSVPGLRIRGEDDRSLHKANAGTFAADIKKRAGKQMKMINSFFQTDGPQQPSASALLNPVFQSFAKRYKLTPRETQVMRILVLEGLRNDEIAAVLHISPKTLKNHIACMMKKTDTVSSRGLQALFFNFAMKMLLPSA